MTALDLDPRLDDPDGVYACLAQALDRCNQDEAIRLLARLALILANQLGDTAAVREAIRLAADGLEDEGFR